MKSGICKQFIVLSLLFSFGIVIGALSNPSLSELTQKELIQEKSQPNKIVKNFKKLFA